MDTTYLSRASAAALGAATGRIITFNGSATLDYLYLTLVSTATVGNRQLEVRVRDAAGVPNTLFAMPMGSTQAASLTRNYAGFESAPRETAAVSTTLCFPWCDDIEIPNGGSVQILDTANIDVNDTLAYVIGVRDDG